MNFAILFSGQGAQKPKMGIDFMSDPIFKETIEIASDAIGSDMVTIFNSRAGELDKTINVQPALVAFEAGIYRMLKRDLPHLNIAGMVGLSLGEYGAMFASGALSLKDTISLVKDRAKYMQDDADKIASAMTALVKPDLEKINQILTTLQAQGQRVYIANYNSPKQIVISGEQVAVENANEQIKKDKAALKVVSLKVNGAFHTPLFNTASQKMHDRLKNVQFKENTIPVISNTTQKPFAGDWGQVMAHQLAEPTHFGDCLSYLVKNYEANASLEIGPGKALSSFAKQVDRRLTRYKIGTFEEYQEFLEQMDELNK
ncbi:[acyl-carrier-protein] S-malonyltransferase [Lactobacillus colini]|uniref:Malonyl CoA-acyl carrier protein transacylase n=1 Tax=Lactobacillus colini TaxID=1819254 RepID=A0ABS4MD98_9LACO|nr:ACP S-malonyltransferase [Lactobacillus colini]MBP2057626.1 [acyl-carrier-protein] S-malonyltransferase [Lactobacillus colini]